MLTHQLTEGEAEIIDVHLRFWKFDLRTIVGLFLL